MPMWSTTPARSSSRPTSRARSSRQGRGQAPGIDLAVLKLDDESFFERPSAPADRSKAATTSSRRSSPTDIPRAVRSCRSPRDRVAGRVCRVLPVDQGLRIQVDAAINLATAADRPCRRPVDRRCLQRLQRSDNIGYIIPMEEIELFLKDIQDGHYDGKPVLEIEFQKLENARSVPGTSSTRKPRGSWSGGSTGPDPPDPLQVGDVITRIGDHAIDNAGMVHMEGDRMIESQYMIQRLAHDGRLPLTIVRNGKDASSICRSSPSRGSSPIWPRKPLLLLRLRPARLQRGDQDYTPLMAAYGGGATRESNESRIRRVDVGLLRQPPFHAIRRPAGVPGRTNRHHRLSDVHA